METGPRQLPSPIYVEALISIFDHFGVIIVVPSPELERSFESVATAFEGHIILRCPHPKPSSGQAQPETIFMS